MPSIFRDISVGIILLLILPSSLFVTFHATNPASLRLLQRRIECRNWKWRWRSRRRGVEGQVVDSTEALCGGGKAKRAFPLRQICRKATPNCAVVGGESRRLAGWLGMIWREVIYGWVESHQICGPATMPV